MADPKIRIRRSATPNKVPSTTQLQLGELAINTYDGKVYLEQDQGGVGVGTTVIAVNPWGVGIGSTAYNTQFTAGKVGIGTTNAQYNLDIGGNVNFTGNLYQDGSLYTSGTTGVGIRTAGGIVGYAATILDFRGPGVTTAYYSSATGIGTINFHSVTSGGGGSNASVTVSDSAPSSPSNGDLWFKSNVGELYLWYTDGSSNQWVEASGGSNTVVTSDTAPPSPNDGDLWWNSDTGELKIYYNDGNSSQWVDANSEGGFVQYWTQNNTNGTLGVHTTGFVGIGTTTATDALTVKGNVNVTGVATFSGDVKVGGVLTYEDVKNVDAIGVVTARTGLKVLAGGANIVDGTTTDELNVTGISTFAGNIDVNADLDVDGITNLDDVNISGVTTATGGVKVGTAATICSEGNMTIDRPSAGIITATKFIGDGSDLTGVISGIGIGTAGGVVGYAATIVHFKGAGVTTAYYNASTGIGTVFFHSATTGGGGANVTVSDTPPGSPTAGDLWWESDIGELKIYYSDGDSSQWVDASGADSLVQIGTSAPTGAVSGDLWFNSETGDFMVYYTDANSSAWVSVNAVNSNTKWITNATGIHTTGNVGIGTTTATDPLTVVGATDLDGTLLVSGITTFGSHVYHGDNDKAIFGDGSDLEIYHSGTKSIINDAGTGNLELQVGGSTKFATMDSGVNVSGITSSTNLNVTGIATIAQASPTTLNVAGVTTFKGDVLWDNSTNAGKDILWDESDNSLNFSENVSIKLNDASGGQNASLSNGGSGLSIAAFSGGTVKIAASGGTWIRNQAGEFNIKCNSNASTDLYYANVKTFETVSGGAKVTGALEVTGNTKILGVLTYEDVTNVDSVGIATARQGLRITGGGLDVVGVSTFGGVVKIPAVAGTNNAAWQNVLHQTSAGIIDGGSGLQYHPANDSLSVNGTTITSGAVYSAGGSSLKLADSNYSSTTNVLISNKVEIAVNDNGAGAFKLKEGSNEYITVDTTNSSELIKFGTAGTERLRINSSGQILVGTTAHWGSDVKLHLANSGNTYLTLTSGTTHNGVLAFSDDGTERGSIDYDHNGDHMLFKTAAGERLRITSSGELLIGYTSALSHSGIGGYLNITGTGSDNSSITQSRFSNDAWCPFITMAKSRSGTKGTHTVVQANDYLGYINFAGSDGTDFDSQAATITVRVDGTPGSNDMPGRIEFATTADGASSPTERLRISSNGQVSISSDGTTDGLLTIKGASDQVSTPSIRLLCGSDTREVSITNTSGDFVASVHGNDNAVHGHIKMFESGIFDINNGGASGSNVNRLRITSSGYVGINESSPNRLLYISSNSSTAYSGTSGTNDAVLRLHNKNGTDNSGVNNHVGIEMYVANGATSVGMLSMVRTGNNIGDFTYKTRTGASTYAESFRITSEGKLGIGHHQGAQIAKELTIRPGNDGGIRFVRPGETSGSPNIHLDLTTTTSGSAFPTAEGYTVKYKTMNCDQIFETYEGGGTGGNISFRTSTAHDNHETMRIYPDGHVTMFGSGPWSDPGVTDFRMFNGNFDIADDSSVSLTSAANTGALVCVGSFKRSGGSITYASALFFVTYGSTTITEISDPRGIFSTSDTDGQVCVLKTTSTGGTFSVKNRIGVTNKISVNIIGLQGL